MSSSKIGFSDDESKEFSKAVKQSLLVTTPLQVLLDMLFTRLQNQAEAFTELSQRVGRLEVRDLDKEEMLRRVQFCEEKLSELTASKLSPFKQQEMMSRIEALEKSQLAPENMGLAAESKVLTQQESYVPPKPLTPPPPPPPPPASAAPSSYLDSSSSHSPAPPAPVVIAMEVPAEYEQRLAAVEDKLKGVYNLSGKLISLEAMAEKMGTSIPDLDYNPTLMAELPKPRPNTYVPLPEAIAPPADSQAPSSAQLSAQAAELNLAIKNVARETEELAVALGAVKAEISKNKAEQEEGDAKLSKRIDSIQSQSLDSERRLTSDLASVRALAKREPEVSFADIEVIKSKVDAAMKEGKDAHEAVSALKAKEIKALNDLLLELKDSKKEGGSGMREMDTLFHNRISALEAKVGDIHSEVQVAVANVIDGLAKSTDLEELGALLESKTEELQGDVQQLAQQQASLAQSVNGMATWLATAQAGGGGGGAQGQGTPAFSPSGPAALGGGIGQPLVPGKAAKRSPPMAGGFHLPQVNSSTSPPVKRALKAQDLEDFNASIEEQAIKAFGSPKRVAAPLPGGTAPLKPSNNRVPVFLG